MRCFYFMKTRLANVLRTSRRVAPWLIGSLLILTATTATAAGFIQTSRISGDESAASVAIRFNCKATYLGHEPQGTGDRLRIYLDPTTICNGVSPQVAETASRFRPANADTAHLVDVEYDGDSAADPLLTLTFSRPVNYTVTMSAVSFELVVQVTPASTVTTAIVAEDSEPTSVSRRSVRTQTPTGNFAINLISYRRVPTIADTTDLALAADQRIYYSEAEVDGATWYRLRLGNFDSADAARRSLAGLRADYPGAWIANVDPGDVDIVLRESGQRTAAIEAVAVANTATALADATIATEATDAVSTVTSSAKVDQLMEDARRAMVAGETSRAVQIYTKILQMPANPRQPEAQEYLALAREKNGQTAHAKAEYERYLDLYAENEGAARVSQRLAALLAADTVSTSAAGSTSSGQQRRRTGDWRLQTFFSQYYRRNVNQQNDQEEIVSQSALYSDINFDARRRGDRFDFTSRVSAGYRSELLPDDQGPGDSLRVSYAYADLIDAVSGLRGRIGRQSRHSGGVLGRFDGATVGYQLNDRVLFNAVVGKPIYSANDDDAPSRSFYGASVNYGPVIENLDLGLFYIEQTVEGIQDRQAVGGQFRYFGPEQSFWGMIDYDLSYGKVASAFLQGTWRFPSRFSIHAVADTRSSPYLSTSNAMIGQPGLSFAELIDIFGEDDLRQFSLDRTADSTTFTIGVSYPLSPKLQINVDASDTTLGETVESGGVFATPGSQYNYISTSLVASSLVKQGDVSIVTARYTKTDTSKVMSLALDSRFPIGRTWRINPRLRVDQRQNLRNDTTEWLFSPGLRLQYRRSQKLRVELELGKQFSERETENVDINLDRESYFINLGYQVFF